MALPGAEALLESGPSVAPELQRNAKFYISFDGTGVPMRPSELVGRPGKQADGSACTREAKLGCVFTQLGLDKEGHPQRDPDSTTYVGAIESSTPLAGASTPKLCAADWIRPGLSSP
jgi:hypothetical protein